MKTEYVAYGMYGTELHKSVRDYMTPTEVGLYIEAAGMNFPGNYVRMTLCHDNVFFIVMYHEMEVIGCTVITVTE